MMHNWYDEANSKRALTRPLHRPLSNLSAPNAHARPPAMLAITSTEPSAWESIVLEQRSAKEALTDVAAEIASLPAEG